MLVARHLLLDRVLARLVAPRLRKGEEEALVAGQSVDHRRLLAAERAVIRSEEHTSELQSLMRISYAVFCLKKKSIIFNKLTSGAHTTYSVNTNSYTTTHHTHTRS